MAVAKNTDTEKKSEHSATRELREKGSEVMDDVRELGGLAKDAAGEQLERAKRRATEGYEAGRDRVADWQDDLRDRVRDKPVQSLLIAAGVGALLGVFWRR
ncbi:MAG: hypothetical protein RL885_10740 [Planctomycetota bacterium]